MDIGYIVLVLARCSGSRISRFYGGVVSDFWLTGQQNTQTVGDWLETEGMCPVIKSVHSVHLV